VRLTEPNGYQIEVVCGIAPVDPIPVRRQKLNTGEAPTARAGELMRLPKGPVARQTRWPRRPDDAAISAKAVDWFRDTLGMICSDDVYVENQDNLIGSFNRCDRGDAFVDHHVFFCLRHEKTGLNHLSFEVPDIDDVCMGHDYLKSFGSYEHMWGIGRHVLAAKSTITGPIHGAASTSIGPIAIASTSPTAPISFPRMKRCGRNGANGRRKNHQSHASPVIGPRAGIHCSFPLRRE